MIYKILNQDEWQEFLRAGEFTGSSVDIADGYIHFSTASQVVQTATKHFAGKDNLVLLEIDEQKLGANLKFEPSRGGDLFPHLYGSLSLNEVATNWPLPLNQQTQQHEFPAEVTL